MKTMFIGAVAAAVALLAPLGSASAEAFSGGPATTLPQPTVLGSESFGLDGLRSPITPVQFGACPSFNERSQRVSRSNAQLYAQERFDIIAGGGIDLSQCREFNGVGYVARRPDLTIDYVDDGNPRELVFYVEGQCDTVLLINDRTGTWHFNDDFFAGNLNPAVRLAGARSGTYDIWIGTYGSQTCSSQLIVETFENFSTFTSRHEPGGGQGGQGSFGGQGGQGGAAQGPEGAQFGWEYEFTNNCRHPVQIVIFYRDLDLGWRAEGWWQFSPGESARLENRSGARLRSDNAIWYYYAETTNQAGLTWSGERTVEFDGRTLGMRRKQDNEGTNTWAVQCP